LKSRPLTTTVADLLTMDDILFDLEVQTKGQLFHQIGWHVERAYGVPRESVVLGLLSREGIKSTGLGDGVAVPHARIDGLAQVKVVYARLRSPIAFDAPDGKPVSSVLAILVPKQANEEHFRILAEATRMLFDRRFRQRLDRCVGAPDVKHLFDYWSRARRNSQ
jgi:PTS system nitrogen regulatory IIA component